MRNRRGEGRASPLSLVVIVNTINRLPFLTEIATEREHGKEKTRIERLAA